MDVKFDNAATRVTLSRRNLEQLLKALTQLGPEVAYLYRMTDNGMLYVFAEENDVHYGVREAGPGFDGFLDAPTTEEVL
jgi:hypothetical protein